MEIRILVVDIVEAMTVLFVRSFGVLEENLTNSIVRIGLTKTLSKENKTLLLRVRPIKHKKAK